MHSDAIMSMMASQIADVSIVCSSLDQMKTPKLRVTGLCKWIPVDSPHKGSATRKMFPCDDVIMITVLLFVDRFQNNVFFYIVYVE